MRRPRRIYRIDCGSLLYATWIAEFRRRASHVENLITVPLQPPRHNVPHPIPKHTDKSQHRTPHHNPRTQNNLGTTFHIQYRSIQTQVNTVPHTTTQELLKKKPEGCAEGPWLYGPFAVFHSFPKQKNQALCQESKNKTKNQPHNKQRKRKSQRKIKKKNKRKNKGEKA